MPKACRGEEVAAEVLPQISKRISKLESLERQEDCSNPFLDLDEEVDTNQLVLVDDED